MTVKDVKSSENLAAQPVTQKAAAVFTTSVKAIGKFCYNIVYRFISWLLLPPQTDQVAESHMLKRALVGSTVLHLAVISIGPFVAFRSTLPILEEWAMDADIFSDQLDTAPHQSVLPQAKPDEQASVPSQMLPQITKKFSVDQPKDEETVSEKDIVKEKVAEQVPKPTETPQAPKALALPNDPEEKNRLKMEEAIKRLALERLRQQEKKSPENQAPQSANDVKVADASKNKNDLSQGSVGFGSSDKKYVAVLTQAIKRVYNMPEAYNLKNAKIHTVLSVKISEKGDIMALEVKESSGDLAFDAIAIKTVKDASPLPKPPREQVGQEILFDFKL